MRDKTLRGRTMIGVGAAVLVLSAGAFGAAPADVIDLADIVAGGDGYGTAPAANVGINADTGTFVTAGTSASIPNTGLATQSVDGSDFIDSVFIIASASQEITQSGVIFDFAAGDAVGTIYDHIRKDNNPDRTRDFLLVGGQEFTSGVGIHASAGITFDLGVMRSELGEENVKCISTFAGMDDCSSGDVNLYLILSDDVGILDWASTHAVVNGGDLLEMDIPVGARYLTLATGSNGADACDHGTFANAWIRASCEEGECTEIQATPESILLGVDWTQQLVVECIDVEGVPREVTADPETSYETGDSTVATVSADGVVTAVGKGIATITVMRGGLSDDVTVEVIGDVIDLGNIAAGGDGKTPKDQLEYIGVNPDTGLFTNARLNSDVSDTGENPQEVLDSDFIDSVFILNMASMDITTTGVGFDFLAGDVGNGWDVILDGRENDGPEYLQIETLGRFDRGLGIHANAGITFDLGVMRAEFGADAVKTFTTYAGDASGVGTGAGSIDAYVILSSESEPLQYRVLGPFTDDGEFVQLEIPGGARFLTLAIGGAGDGIGSDHGIFANAWILSEMEADPCVEMDVRPDAAFLALDWTRQLAVTTTTESGIVNTVTISSGTTYATSDPEVAQVSAAGLVTATGVGTATITVTVEECGLEEEVSITVIGEIIDLGNIAAGGDGVTPKDQLPYIGINPDTGAFATDRLNADVPNTGANPQEVIDSNLIESVFILNMAAMDITTTGVVFDFNAVDVGDGWDLILEGRENDGPDYLEVATLDRFDRGLGIHANAGITFDLEAIRAEHGADAVKYVSAYAGDATGRETGSGSIDAYVIISDEFEPMEAAVLGPFTDDGQFVQMEIPEGAKYVTFAIGGAGDGIGVDHGVFGNAFITGCDITDPASCGGPSGPEFRRGDIGVAPDGILTIGDAVFLLNYMFASGPAPSCLDAADIDDTGDFTIGDAVWLLNYQFVSGKEPLPPFTACGPDPTPNDPLDCVSFPPCE
ncbi:MAG: NPCBM/NEW2 domain-containing protein [Planctomycetes bacterium]|nr:NPCBM/NEW2 domain-containing protein [Planctomycetota bacterium]